MVKNHIRKTRACALVFVSDFSHPSVYKSHILNGTINKLYIIANSIESKSVFLSL